MLLTEKKKSSKKDLDIDLDENLNINKELVNKTNKTSSKILNKLFENQINNDSNLIANKNIKLRSSIYISNPKNAIFTNQKPMTKRELRRSLSGYFNLQRRVSINNFNSKKPNLNNNKIKKQMQNYIEYDDLYFEDDMFIPESSSYPNEHEEDFLLKLQFIEDNNYNDDDIIDLNLRNKSISYKINYRDNLHLKYFSNNNNNFGNKQNEKKSTGNTCKIDSLFFDEKEKIGSNIMYLDNTNNTSNIKNDNKENSLSIDLDGNDNNEQKENNIAYISPDLLIKKIALENFRTNNAYIFECFLQQFKYFIPLDNFLRKIVQAFNYYNTKSIKENSSELVNFLNDIIFLHYDDIKADKNLLGFIQIFYLKIKNIKFDYYKVNQDLITIDYLLFKNNITEKDIKNRNKSNNKEKNNVLEKIYALPKTIKNKISFFRSKKDKDKKSNKNEIQIKEKEKKHNYDYFYIFDYTKEEIAGYLTYESYHLLSKIPVTEFYNKNFIKADKEKLSPNIMKIIERSDKLIYFIIEDICSYDHKSERVEIIEKWLRIASKCMEYKNYNDLVMLNILFCNYLFKKMKLTWQKLSKKSLTYMNKLNNFCSGNQCYKNIRKEINKCKEKPYVPFLGILLKEVMGVEEMKYTINNNINILKIDKLDKTIKHFFEFKNRKYSFDKPKQLDILSNVSPKTGEEIETIIKQLEPELLIHANKNDQKRRTQSDELFYK